VLKQQVLDYIDSRTSKRDSDNDHFYGEIARASLKKAKDQVFTEVLYLMCWEYYAAIRNARVTDEKPDPSELICSLG